MCEEALPSEPAMGGLPLVIVALKSMLSQTGSVQDQVDTQGNRGEKKLPRSPLDSDAETLDLTITRCAKTDYSINGEEEELWVLFAIGYYGHRALPYKINHTARRHGDRLVDNSKVTARPRHLNSTRPY